MVSAPRPATATRGGLADDGRGAGGCCSPNGRLPFVGPDSPHGVLSPTGDGDLESPHNGGSPCSPCSRPGGSLSVLVHTLASPNIPAGGGKMLTPVELFQCQLGPAPEAWSDIDTDEKLDCEALVLACMAAQDADAEEVPPACDKEDEEGEEEEGVAEEEKDDDDDDDDDNDDDDDVEDDVEEEEGVQKKNRPKVRPKVAPGGREAKKKAHLASALEVHKTFKCACSASRSSCLDQFTRPECIGWHHEYYGIDPLVPPRAKFEKAKAPPKTAVPPGWNLHVELWAVKTEVCAEEKGVAAHVSRAGWQYDVKKWELDGKPVCRAAWERAHGGSARSHRERCKHAHSTSRPLAT